MDIREVTPEEKIIYINKVKNHFQDLRRTLDILEKDMESTEVMTEATSIWISGQLSNWWTDFVTQIKEVKRTQQSLNSMANEIKDAENDRTVN